LAQVREQSDFGGPFQSVLISWRERTRVRGVAAADVPAKPGQLERYEYEYEYRGNGTSGFRYLSRPRLSLVVGLKLLLVGVIRDTG
jgi:hypothetical protein